MNALPSIAYVVPWEKFVYVVNGRWQVQAPLSMEGVIQFLVAESGDPTAYAAIQQRIKKEHDYPRVYGVDMMPNKPLVARVDGKAYINTWVKPTLAPAPGPYPRVQTILGWLTNHDTQGEVWLRHWMAAKVQDPELLPKTTVVFAGQQGSGKNTFSFLMSQMLGPENCAEITRKAIENKFNARWANKLFIFADEVVTRDNLKDVSQDLKILITTRDSEVEKKGKDQFTQKNRIALAIASNDDTTPVWVENGDRRYTVFANHDLLTDEYRNLIAGCFHANRPTDTFLAEIAGFWADLLAMKVDFDLLRRPYDNADRQALIAASAPPHKSFLKAVDELGFDAFLDGVVVEASGKGPWHFGKDGVSKAAIYEAYVNYAKRIGGKHLGFTRFAAAVRNHRPTWASVDIGGVACWVVRRTAGAPAPTETNVLSSGSVDFKQ